MVYRARHDALKWERTYDGWESDGSYGRYWIQPESDGTYKLQWLDSQRLERGGQFYRSLGRFQSLSKAKAGAKKNLSYLRPPHA